MDQDAMVETLGRIQDVLRDFIERMAEGIEFHSENSSEGESEPDSEDSSEEESEPDSEESSEEESEPDSEDSSEEEFEPLLGEFIKVGTNEYDYAIVIEYKGHVEALVYNLPEKDEDDEKNTFRVETMMKPLGDTGASIGPGTSEPLFPQFCKGRKIEVEIKVVETPFSQYIGALEGLEEAILEEYQRRLSSETPKYFFTSEHMEYLIDKKFFPGKTAICMHNLEMWAKFLPDLMRQRHPEEYWWLNYEIYPEMTLLFFTHLLDENAFIFDFPTKEDQRVFKVLLEEEAILLNKNLFIKNDSRKSSIFCMCAAYLWFGAQKPRKSYKAYCKLESLIFAEKLESINEAAAFEKGLLCTCKATAK